MFVPAGWFHHFKSATDSISLTWNFVHQARLKEFVSYLQAGPPEIERKQLVYAYFQSPNLKCAGRDKFITTLTQSAPWIQQS